MPVAVGEESAKYQVTWSEDHEAATSGTHMITLYDEDNYAQLRKVGRFRALPINLFQAQRNNEDLSKVTKFGTISLYHPVRPSYVDNHHNQGASRGRFVASETLGVIGAVVLFYMAHQFRSGITN